MRPRSRGAGGTEGGVGAFLVGFAMAVAGAYLLTTRVTVSSGLWTLWGYDVRLRAKRYGETSTKLGERSRAVGLSLLPLIVGIGILFFNGRSVIGWLLTLAGAVIIGIGIIANLQIYFRPTSLFATLTMLVLLAGGLGLIARSVRPE